MFYMDLFMIYCAKLNFFFFKSRLYNIVIILRLCPPKKLDSKHRAFGLKSIWFTKILDM